MDENTKASTLEKLGIAVDNRTMRDYKAIYDAALPAPVTTPSASTPVQFLQWINPEIVEIVTAPTDIDEIVGRTVAGSWEDEEIVQPILERLGQATPYGDHANPAQASWNLNFEKRTIVRFEQSFEVGALEEARAAKIRVNSAKEKREACATALNIERNAIGYNGYAGSTYGLLNDPNLPSYVTVATNAAGTSTKWEDKSFEEIQADILAMIAGLQNGSKNVYNPKRTKATLVVALSAEQYLNKTNSYGTKTVAEWLKENYPTIEVKSTYFFDGANGGANVAYLFADEIAGKKTLAQYTPEVFRMLGVFNKGKTFEEFFSNATAGVMVRNPIGVYCASGI